MPGVQVCVRCKCRDGVRAAKHLDARRRRLFNRGAPRHSAQYFTNKNLYIVVGFKNEDSTSYSTQSRGARTTPQPCSSWQEFSSCANESADFAAGRRKKREQQRWKNASEQFQPHDWRRFIGQCPDGLTRAAKVSGGRFASRLG